LEGWLYKLGGWRKTQWEKRWFSLRENTLYYSREMNGVHQKRGKGRLTVQDISLIGLIGYELHKKDYCFNLITTKKQYFLYADSAEERDSWIQILRDAKKLFV